MIGSGLLHDSHSLRILARLKSVGPDGLELMGRSDPSKPLDQIIDEAEKRKPNSIKIILDREDKGRLNRFATEDEAAANLILGLESRGY